MNTLLVILLLVSLIAMVVGLVKPGLVIRWGEKKTRPRVLVIYGGLFIVLLIVLGMTGSPNSEKASSPDGNKAAKETVNKEPETKYTYDSAEMRVGDWCMEHQFPNNPKLSISKGKPDGSFYENDGKKYYLFTLTGLQRAVDILVDPYTGDLLFNDVGIKPYSLNTWYGQYRKDYEGANKTSSDSRLAGRWVADDGARLDFSGNGIGITNLNLWSYEFGLGDKNITWRTENGRLIIAAKRTVKSKYSLGKQGYGDILTMEHYGNFKRTEGTDGLYGTWMPIDSGGGGIQFFEDKTGNDQINRLGKFTWSTENGYLTRTYSQERVFDYTMENSKLIIFGNNGNIVFTKVGS
ncbi:hypothetical protein [Sporomusa termitida]|uniref:Uncharacterized protein n=1 Tax=Sporomusa termitida TaxID=2377 RepID=A0A517DQR1_9FIRM|nr:hypothetical protein [Sporomusa termitida]QDR79606.1 hypothetical protein SPTER_08830 [Sporomusa termitida]